MCTISEPFFSGWIKSYVPTSKGGVIMCLLFYLAGVFSGYITWRLVSAPYLWDAEEEAKYWKKEWVVVKRQNDLLTDNND
jgi:hypothetical protein